MQKMQRIAVFLPVHNEAETLAAVLRKIPKEIRGHGVDLIVVDDHSTDRSRKIAERFTAHVVTSKGPLGVGAATKTGLTYIADQAGKYGLVVKLDADGQHGPEFLTQMVNRLCRGDDVVICSRFRPWSDQAHTPVDRLLLNVIFTEALRRITKWKLTDVRSGYVGFQAGLIRQIAPKLITVGYGVPMEILLRIWGFKPDARLSEITHPARYSIDISPKLGAKYRTEDPYDKANRLQVAYAALLKVVEDMQIPKEHILKINGFRNREANAHLNR